MTDELFEQIEEQLETMERRIGDIRQIIMQYRAPTTPLPTLFTGYVRPLVGYSVNVRERATVDSPKIGTLAPSDVEATAGSGYDEKEPGRYLWHKLARGGYVRADVVTFSTDTK